MFSGRHLPSHRFLDKAPVPGHMHDVNVRLARRRRPPSEEAETFVKLHLSPLRVERPASAQNQSKSRLLVPRFGGGPTMLRWF